MNINDTFPSKYLKASDLQGRNINVTMERVVMETVGEDHRPIVYFAGKQKGLVLNKTNANTIAGMYGPETDNWQGRAIVLFSTQVDYQGRQVEAIRVGIRPPQQQAQQLPSDPPPRQSSASPDDVPFDTEDEINI